MALTRFSLFCFALGAIRLACAANPVAFNVTEPVSIAGVPPVKLAPGSYVLRTVHNSGGKFVQVLSKRRDYVYTTVLTIPAERPYASDHPAIVFSESTSGVLPALHYWFPAGETSGYEFVIPASPAAPEQSGAPKQLQRRADGEEHHAVANPEESRALNEILALIESGKLGAARDRFRRNYFVSQNRDGASTSFALALLMVDRREAWTSLDLVRRLDPERMRSMSRLNVDAVVESLASARSNLKTSRVRRFLLDFAMDNTYDPIARTAILSFERHVVKVDSFPVEIALDRRREEREKERSRQEQWVLAIAKLNDCIKSLLNRVGALEYSASAEGRFGSVTLRVVLTQRRLIDLGVIAERSRRAICDGHAKLERLISQRNAAVARELDSLRSALQKLDRQSGFNTTSQFGSLRNWKSTPASGVSRDLMELAESATLTYQRPLSLFGTDRGYIQLDIAASLARLAEWAHY
jgi:hypothetical protein